MDFKAKQTLAICVLGIVTLTGCASSRPTQTSTAPTASTAAKTGQRASMPGKIASIENASGSSQGLSTTSGSSGMATSSSSGSAPIITVQFADGTQGRYAITESAAPLAVGQPVSVVPSGDGFLITSP